MACNLTLPKRILEVPVIVGMMVTFKGEPLLVHVITPRGANKHMTFGLSYSPSEFGEWNLSYQHAFKEHVSSEQTAFGVPGSLSMYQNAFEVGYSWKF